MEKDLKISILLDFYGDLLTEKQFNCTDLYYNEDFSLSEISEHEGITRQGVRDSIEHAKEQLYRYEEKLQLLKKQKQVSEIAKKMKSLAGQNEKLIKLIDKLTDIQ